MGIVLYIYIDKCLYEVQEQKEVPVWYTGIYRSILSTGLKNRINTDLFIRSLFIALYSLCIALDEVGRS
jgi:hypothetical protein